jgi:hypothetical protein
VFGVRRAARSINKALGMGIGNMTGERVYQARWSDGEDDCATSKFFKAEDDAKEQAKSLSLRLQAAVVNEIVLEGDKPFVCRVLHFEQGEQKKETTERREFEAALPSKVAEPVSVQSERPNDTEPETGNEEMAAVKTKTKAKGRKAPSAPAKRTPVRTEAPAPVATETKTKGKIALSIHPAVTYSEMERRIFESLPKNGEKISTNELVERIYGNSPPFNARGAIVAMGKKLMQKTVMNDEDFRIGRSTRNGPHPVTWWIQQRG